ncbi:MAG: PEGA domain-containing protein [Chitinispirillaceae bacterium]|nr:PEGA domain-containing protein [Chitinispirillaceae bacterium]
MKKSVTALLTVMVPAVFSGGFHPAAAPGDGRLVIRNIPDSTEIFVNGLSRVPDGNGVVPIAPGPLLLEIKRQHVVVYSTFFAVDSSAQKTIPIECIDDCALLHVMTEPPGATLSMNGTVLGTTPYLNRFIKPGSYSIMATYPGYIPVIRRVELSADSSPLFSFQMELTLAVKDSIATAKRAFHRRRQAIQSAVFGGAGIAMAAAGAWFDTKAIRYLDAAQDNSKTYTDAKSNDECRRAKDAYQDNRDNAKKPMVYRNLLYGAAGACVIGFYLSFVF